METLQRERVVNLSGTVGRMPRGVFSKRGTRSCAQMNKYIQVHNYILELYKCMQGLYITFAPLEILY